MSEKNKTKSIYIEPEDEITSVIARIQNSLENQLFIVVPERLSLLQSLVNLKLVAKFSKEKKRRLTLITTDPITKNLAEKVGIPVRHSLSDEYVEKKSAESSPKIKDAPPAINWWGTPLRQPNKAIEIIEEKPVLPEEKDGNEKEENKTVIERIEAKNQGIFNSKYVKKTAFWASRGFSDSLQKTGKFSQKFINSLSDAMGRQIVLSIILAFGVVFFVSAVLFFLIPKAEIKLYPKTESFQQQFTIQAIDLVKENNFVTRQIPATFLETFQEGSGKIETTGEKNIGAKAKGTIAIKNKRSQILLKAGTILASTDNIKFSIVNDTIVKGAYVDELGVTRINQNPSVEIEAVNVGEEGNIKPTDFVITGYSADLVWGESYKTFSGGFSRKVRAVSKEDINKLEEDVKITVYSKAYQDLQSQKSELQKIPTESIKTDILEQKWSHVLGDEATELALSIKIRSSGIAIKEQDIKTMLAKSFDNVIPTNYTVVKDSQKVWYELTSVDDRLKAINFTGGINALLIPYFDEKGLKSMLTFKSEQQAGEILKTISSMEFIRSPEFSYWPLNFGRLPIWSNNIKFVIFTSA